MIDGLVIPEELLLLWAEKKRDYDQTSTTGSFEMMAQAEADYNQIAHFVMSKAHTAMMAAIEKAEKINEGVTH
jgi:hypothetical protein